jgi:ribonuclease-3
MHLLAQCPSIDLPMTTVPPTSELMQTLGFDREPAHLHEALTHASFVNEHPGASDYERLEFLGDAVLGLCVSELLLRHVPRASEGRLTRMRAALVNTEALASFARTLDLGRYVRFGKGAACDAVQSKVLADVVEALVGAAWLDHGLEAARELTSRIVGDVSLRAARLAARDPKSLLQENVQQAGGTAPVYATVSVEGPDHDRWFEVEVEVDGQPRGRGRGRTKKQAEREAARSALTLEPVDPEDSK